MIVLITGSSSGIGYATALRFLKEHFSVIGFDIKSSTIKNSSYLHYVCDVSKKETLPHLSHMPDIVINNAGTDKGDIIGVNLQGTINVSEKYISKNLKSIVFISSASARTGAENPDYAASKGGVVSYMKNIASRISKWGATSNSISPGGVYTSMNKNIIGSSLKMKAVLDETELKKWATADEIAEWIFFVSTINKSMTAQDILIDNGEEARFNFIK